MKHKKFLTIGIVLGLGAFAQAGSQSTGAGESGRPTPVYQVNVTSRTVQAVNYRHRSGASKLDFAGTDLMPSASGQAKIESKKGYMEVEVQFADFQKPTVFGTEYLTYVLWAISPEGRAVNLGELLVGSNHRGKLDVTTDLQAFALIVTAEPYYAVHQPSNVVVLENVVRSDTKGSSEAVNAKYELMERGGYIPTGYKFDPVVLDAKLPLEFMEARNALRIAQSEGAEQYAGESYQHAVKLMDTADRYATEKHSSKKELIATSREAVQTAEDARTIAVKRIDEQRRGDERRASSDQQARTQAQADDANRQKEQAQSDAARAQSDAARAQSDAARAQADMAANQTASSAAISAAQSDAARAQADMAANQSASSAALSAAQSDAARAQADMAANQSASAAALTAAQAEADRARQAEQEAITDKAAMRKRLSVQLNLILQTRDSARGLIISMSDVLFDTGKYSLKPGAREKLAKVAGILIAYPGLNIEVGGYTDNVGGDDMNQKLSENRAGTVRDYLVQQGVGGNSVSARGFGNSLPVASNGNASGRQENRRVELVVSGDAIGTEANTTTGSLQ